MSEGADETLEPAAFPSPPPRDEFAAAAAAGRLKHMLFGESTAPEELAGYRIVATLGVGGMGEVFRAHDPRLGRDVALKVMQAERRGGARLLAEARALAQLRHPNVVPVFEAGEAGDRVFLAMELVDGRTLDTWVRQERPGWRAIVEAYAQAGRGLAAAHRAGMIHRDFKPGNVLIDADGRVQVLDFGLAHACTQDAAVTAEDAEVALVAQVTSRSGTPAYMAPEQLEGHTLTPACDQFSFCVALFEALHGEVPFADLPLVARIVPYKDGRAPVGTRRIPRWLTALIRRGLSYAPEKRFPSMNALLDELTRPRGKRPRTAALVGAAGLAVALALTTVLVGGVDTRQRCLDDHHGRHDMDGSVDVVASHHASAPWPGADEDWGHASALVNMRTERWDRALARACDAGSEAALRCLDRRQDELAALLRALQEGQVAARGRSAARAVAELPAVAECAEPTDDAPSPKLQAALAELTARSVLGELGMAELLAAQTEERARAEADARGEAEAALARGRVLHRLQREDARTALTRAREVAQATGATDVVVDANHALLRVELDTRPTAPDCTLLSRAEDALEGRPHPGRWGATQAFLAGRCAAARNEVAEARRHYERSLAQWQALPDRETRLARAEVEAWLGRLLHANDEEPAGLAAYRRGLALEHETTGRAGCAGDCIATADLGDGALVFELVARHSGRCVDVPGADMVRGKQLHQWVCLGRDNEFWRFRRFDDGTYWIRNLRTDACIAVDHASPDNLVPIVQEDCLDLPHQRWQLVERDRLVELRSALSQKCIDVSASGLDDGAPLVQYECNGNYNQRFELRVVPAD